MLLHEALSDTVLYSWASVNLTVLLTSSLLNVWNLLVLVNQACAQPSTCGHIVLAHLFAIELLSCALCYAANVANITFPYWDIWDNRAVCQTVSFFCTYLAICSSMRYTHQGKVWAGKRCRPSASETAKGKFVQTSAIHAKTLFKQSSRFPLCPLFRLAKTFY